MPSSTSLPPITVYLYPFSPFGRKITAYLTLRGIPHSEVHQPAMPPRPDLDLLNIRYRRIPIMSIGRDFYCDTKCILAKLEELFPGEGRLGAKGGKEAALEMLLEGWSTDVVFQRLVMCLPADTPVLNDSSFTKDRSELWGGKWGPDRQREVRPGALADLNGFFDFLETLIADDEGFAAGAKPGLADIHALNLFLWAQQLLPDTMPTSVITSHPKTESWLSRYSSALDTAKSSLGEIPVLSGADAARKILAAGYAEDADADSGKVDAEDPVVESLGLKKGDLVDVFPTDILSGLKHRDTGKLVGLGREEVVVEVEMKEKGEGAVRVHFPRWNYKVQRAEEESK